MSREKKNGEQERRKEKEVDQETIRITLDWYILTDSLREKELTT